MKFVVALLSSMSANETVRTSVHARQTGITLLEVMIVVAILGILAAIAAPSYQEMIERNRLKEAAESLKTDLQWARGEAIKRSQNVTLAFTGTACYGIAVGATACNCTVANSCALKVVNATQFNQVNWGTLNNVTFESRRGTVVGLAANATLTSTFTTTHYGAGIRINSIGRVEVCSSGSKALPGYPTC